MQRSLKISLMNSNNGKIDQINALWTEYQKAVNDFISECFQKHNPLTEQYIKDYESPLSYRFKQCAKRQAQKIFKTWCRNKKKKNRPVLTKPSMTLDYRFITILRNSDNTSFDLWIKLSTLNKGYTINLPSRSYDYLNKYFGEWNLSPGGRLIRKDNGDWFLSLTFEKEPPCLLTHDKKIGVDIGYRKLLTTSDKTFHGTDFTTLADKAIKKQRGSKGSQRVRSEIKNYVNRTVKEVFESNPSLIVVEDLKNLKKNKRGVWSKKINRKFGFWIYSYMLQRIEQLCEVAGVQCHKVDPKYTSQECPICGTIEKGNRHGEIFKCVQCNFSEDADYVGAMNILSRFTQEPIVPVMSVTQ